MRLMPSWVARRAAFDCERWQRTPATASSAELLGLHDVYSAPLLGAGSPDAIVSKGLEALLRYQVFPAHRMKHHVCTDDGVLRSGALIVQRLIAGPVAVEAAVLVESVFDERAHGGRAGFTYATLRGHVERGTATFSVGADDQGVPTVYVESWSLPGNALMAAGRPFLRGIQRSSVREALGYVQGQVSAGPIAS